MHVACAAGNLENNLSVRAEKASPVFLQRLDLKFSLLNVLYGVSHTSCGVIGIFLFFIRSSSIEASISQSYTAAAGGDAVSLTNPGRRPPFRTPYAIFKIFNSVGFKRELVHKTKEISS